MTSQRLWSGTFTSEMYHWFLMKGDLTVYVINREEVDVQIVHTGFYNQGTVQNILLRGERSCMAGQQDDQIVTVNVEILQTWVCSNWISFKNDELFFNAKNQTEK